jgi:hypothetical protein
MEGRMEDGRWKLEGRRKIMQIAYNTLPLFCFGEG